MKDEPYTVTVGVPMYNSEKYIKRCIDSILNQTYQNIELIIVNDGSTDNGLEIINNLKEKYKGKKTFQIYSKINEGPAKARNYIIDKSTGEFIYFIDSDDWIEKNAIEQMVRFQQEYNCDIVRFNYFANCNEKKSRKIKPVAKYSNKFLDIKENKKDLIKDVLFGNLVSYTWLMLIRKQKIVKHLMFEDYYVMEDKIFLIKLLSNIDTVYFSSENLYHYFYNQNSIMHRNKYEYSLEQDIILNKVFNRIIKDFYDNDSELHKVNNTMSSYFVERNLYNIYKSSNKEKMIDAFNKVKNDWFEICKDIDYKYLEESNYANKRDKYLKLWKKGSLQDIIKKYDSDKKIENLKFKIKKIIRYS